jgi:phosphoribosylformimino-5-aminoimidazole carboxamide ribotide isomerase
MLVIPAIDLKDGQCVRLRQGDLKQETVYSEDPAAMATHWQQLGGQLLHLVDLNGAVDGQPRNFSYIEKTIPASLVRLARNFLTVSSWASMRETEKSRCRAGPMFPAPP